MNMTKEVVIEKITSKPAVHRLCYGAFLQAPLWIGSDVLAVPLRALGFGAQLGFVGEYLRKFFGIELTPEAVMEARAHGVDAMPVVVLMFRSETDAPPEELEAGARASLDRAEQVIAWATGDRLTEFAYVALTNNDAPFFRLAPPRSKRRTRLGFGNTGETFQTTINRIEQAANEDPRFAFAIAMLADAVREPNLVFKVCRLFNVLECLAYALKNNHPSRRAVKILLGLGDGAKVNMNVGGGTISYDRIEVAGRIRDKYFHGSPFREGDLNEETRPANYLIEKEPELIVNSLLNDCERAVASWANDASPGRDAARTRESQ